MAQEGVLKTEKTAAIPDLKGELKVKPFDTSIVYATAKAVHVAEGAEMEVHPVLAAKLIASGKATEKQAKAK